MSERKVSTDALESLGISCPPGAGRDAIHLAVLPAVAGHRLRPGEHVGRLEDGRYGCTAKHLGIVDPFLLATVEPGAAFWLVVYPRHITCLRHVWEHPDFPGEGSPVTEDPAVATAKARLAEIADDLADSGSCEEGHEYGEHVPMTYERLMDAAERWLAPEGWPQHTTEHGSESWRSEFPAVAEEFWKLYEIVTGRRIEGDRRQSFFSCTC